MMSGAAWDALDSAVARIGAPEPRAVPSWRQPFDLQSPAFVPSQAAMNDQVDLLLTALHMELNPRAPAFVVPSQSLIQEVVPSQSLIQEQSRDFALPSNIPMPPGLLRRRTPSPDSLFSSSQSSQSDVALQPVKMRPDLHATQGPKANRAGPPQSGAKNSGRIKPDTMKAQLELLRLEDPATVFIARGINKLGFSSPKILRAHFSRFGKVKGVYISHSRVKSMHRGGGEYSATEAHWRLRAAPLGFVVMKSSEATARILAEGEQDVNGVVVRLSPFHRYDEKESGSGSGSSVDEREIDETSAEQGEQFDLSEVMQDRLMGA